MLCDRTVLRYVCVCCIALLKSDLHNALQRANPALSDGRFSIGKIEPIRDESGTVIAYQVEISH